MFEQSLTVFKILCTKYIEKSETMTSSTHSFSYSYQLFNKCLVKTCETSQFHISSLSYIQFS